MDLNDRIEAFGKLGDRISALGKEELSLHASRARNENPWFTKENVELSFKGLAHMLQRESLEEWLKGYQLNTDVPRIVGIVMAGNIPLVGFHDLLSVLISGHFAAVKTSAKDTYLVRLIIDWIVDIAPGLKKNISLREKLTGIDAVIATGSDNSSRYFHYYFGKIPNIIRKNRVSIAIIDGFETDEELSELGKDILSYYGLGCRNVSKIYIPKDYNATKLFPHFQSHEWVMDNHKYKNNYDYHKSIYLINKTSHLDTGFLLWRETRDLVSPLSVLYAETYSDKKELKETIRSQGSKIQCIVSHDHLPFGKAQLPDLWDYADDIDTIKFLSTI